MPSSAIPDSSVPPSISPAVQDGDRLEALRRYDILDTAPEPAFDRITDLAAALFDAPVSIVNFVADDRQWFKSTVGLDETETGLEVSFCIYTVANEEVFVVEDLAADDRFADNPYVTDHGVRFYAGAPLTTRDGHRLGTLCILDTEPRSPSAEALDRLEDLAGMVVDELELRREYARREQTAETLRRSRELLQQSQQLAQVGGWAYDVRRETLSWTDQTYRLHGLSPDRDIDVATAMSFYPPEARSVIEEHFQRLLDQGGRYDLTLQIVTAAGERRWVRTIGEAHREDGTVVRVSGAIQDITERRRAQEERRKQTEVLQTIFDNIPVLIVLFDEDGTPLLVNHHFEVLLRWTREDVAGTADMYERLFPDPAARAEARAFIRAADGEWREFRALGKEGDTADLWATAVALRDGRRVGIALDITQKKEREKRLRLLEAAMEHTRIPILITEANPLDAPGPRIVYANPAFGDVTGYEADDVKGNSPRMLQGEQTDRAALDRIRRALERKEPVREVVRNYTKDGTLYWNDVYIAPVYDDRGAVTHFVSVQDDVTDRIEQRRELRTAKEAAEEADRIKTALLANMNHEFRTPLTSIISFSKLLSSSPELAEDFAPRILGGGQRLLRTLNAVMDFAELEGDQLSATAQRVQLGEVVASVVADFRRLAERADVELTVDAPDGGVVARLDRHLLTRTLTHLVSNAVKFTEEGPVTVRLRRRGAAVEVAVADSGIGIPPAAQERVFEEFYQVSTGNDRTHDGNGLGLTIARRMVERMGGTLTLESTPGTGTTVTVRLPTEPPGTA
jgi:PAS domain S-box-containing protein